MAKYKCRFCRTEIEDNIESLNAHRAPGGDCDKIMEKCNFIEEALSKHWGRPASKDEVFEFLNTKTDAEELAIWNKENTNV